MLITNIPESENTQISMADTRAYCEAYNYNTVGQKIWVVLLEEEEEEYSLAICGRGMNIVCQRIFPLYRKFYRNSSFTFVSF